MSKIGKSVLSDKTIKHLRVFTQPSPEVRYKVWRQYLPGTGEFSIRGTPQPGVHPSTIDVKIKGLKENTILVRAPIKHAIKTGEIGIPASKLTARQKKSLIRRLLNVKEKLKRKSYTSITADEIDALDQVIEL